MGLGVAPGLVGDRVGLGVGTFVGLDVIHADAVTVAVHPE